MAIDEITIERPGAATLPVAVDPIARNWLALSKARHTTATALDTYVRLYWEPMMERKGAVLANDRGPDAEKRFDAAHAEINEETERLGSAAYRAEKDWLSAPAPTVHAVLEKMIFVRDTGIDLDRERLEVVISDLRRLSGGAVLTSLF